MEKQRHLLLKLVFSTMILRKENCLQHNAMTKKKCVRNLGAIKTLPRL